MYLNLGSGVLIVLLNSLQRRGGWIAIQMSIYSVILQLRIII